jgi:hypothetical protein
MVVMMMIMFSHGSNRELGVVVAILGLPLRSVKVTVEPMQALLSALTVPLPANSQACR